MEYIKDEKLLEKFKKDQHIQIFDDDKLITDLKIKDGKIDCEKFLNNTSRQLFSYEPIDFEYLYIVFESRIFENNKNAGDWLKFYDLEEYDVYKIFRITHGVTLNDKIWFKFNEEINDKKLNREYFLHKYVTPDAVEFGKKVGNINV